MEREIDRRSWTGGLRVIIVTAFYPTKARMDSGLFVQQFAWAMARQGHECTVIHPTSLLHRRFGPLPPCEREEDAGGGKTIKVYHPRYMSFSSRNLGFAHTGNWTNASFRRAVLRIASKLRLKPDVVYGHFLYPAAQSAVSLARRVGAVSVAGVGEGEFWTLRAAGVARARRELAEASGFLAVSSPIRRSLMKVLQIEHEKIQVFPNGVDRALFFPRNRVAMRRKFGITKDRFVVAFVGPFERGKGFPQLMEALEGIEDVGLIALGRRGERPEVGGKVVFSGLVPQSQLAELICAADIFVLPTRIEGCCNAVLEAMACGLPIVTSEGEHMDDIVSDQIAIRVDHDDVEAIRESICTLKNDPERRERMAGECLKMAAQFDINERARRVAMWMEELKKEKGQLG